MGCFNCGPAGAGDFAKFTDWMESAGLWFQLRPRRSGGFCEEIEGVKGDDLLVSIAAPPERGILRGTNSSGPRSPTKFQLRPRRSGGFCK